MPDISPQNQKRILDTCLLMESDLAYPHTIESLAAYCDLSPFHFQRVFRAVVGETVMRHLRRMRLQYAAWMLKDSDSPLISIAAEAGFESHPGFTRAFRRTFGMSPRDYRQQYARRPYIRFPSEGPLRCDSAALAACPLNVEISRMESLRVALMRFHGPVSKMAGIWTPMIAWCQRHGLLDESARLLGIHREDWADDEPADDDRLSTIDYHYDAAVAIPPRFAVDDQVSTTFIPGGEVALVQFQGSLNELDRTWRTFAYQWLPASGYQARVNFAFDIYPVDLLTSRLHQILTKFRGIQCQLCLPITPVPMPAGSPID